MRIALRPAQPDTGVVFRRLDLPRAPEIPARADLVGETRLCSCLVSGDTKIYTIEHLMSALSGLGVDNVYVDLDGPEVPIMDGSAAPFVLLIQQAGIEEQGAPKRFLRVKKRIEARDGDKWAVLEPYEGFKLSFSIVYDHPVIEKSNTSLTVDFAETSYLKEVARARTYGFMHDVEDLRDSGLALGGGLENAVVLDEHRVLNAEGLRYADEFIRHKILDAIGDLYLLGRPFLGCVQRAQVRPRPEQPVAARTRRRSGRDRGRHFRARRRGAGGGRRAAPAGPRLAFRAPALAAQADDPEGF